MYDNNNNHNKSNTGYHIPQLYLTHSSVLETLCSNCPTSKGGEESYRYLRHINISELEKVQPALKLECDDCLL